MIKEIRIGMDEVMNCPPETYSIMNILKEKGFPVQYSFSKSDWEPKAGLKYFEFHDHKTGEICVQREEV